MRVVIYLVRLAIISIGTYNWFMRNSYDDTINIIMFLLLIVGIVLLLTYLNRNKKPRTSLEKMQIELDGLKDFLANIEEKRNRSSGEVRSRYERHILEILEAIYKLESKMSVERATQELNN